VDVDVDVTTAEAHIRCGHGLDRGYGCFPHLGPSSPTSAGYLALLRLLWGTSSDRPYPAALTRRAPPADVTVPIADRSLQRPLHDLFVGTSRRLLDDLAREVEAVEPYRRPGLRRDVEAAGAFFEHATARLRALRRGHDLGTGHVTRGQVRDALLAEVRDLLGADVGLPEAPDPALLGARSARSLRRTTAAARHPTREDRPAQ
jgi:hypothetical protein